MSTRASVRHNVWLVNKPSFWFFPPWRNAEEFSLLLRLTLCDLGESRPLKTYMLDYYSLKGGRGEGRGGTVDFPREKNVVTIHFSAVTGALKNTWCNDICSPCPNLSSLYFVSLCETKPPFFGRWVGLDTFFLIILGHFVLYPKLAINRFQCWYRNIRIFVSGTSLLSPRIKNSGSISCFTLHIFCLNFSYYTVFNFR